MSEGYPDYARLARSGQYQLYTGANVTPPYNTAMLQEYVGNFPFINVYTNMASAADVMALTFLYYPDNTFTTYIAFRIAVRYGGSFAVTQYANLSDWLVVKYTTESGNPMQFTEISIYGTQQAAEQRQLSSNDVPLFKLVSSLAGSSNNNYPVQHISPGDAVFFLSTNSATWSAQIQVFDFGSNNYVTLYYFSNVTNGQYVLADVPMIDAPYLIIVSNAQAGAANFTVSWVGR